MVEPHSRFCDVHPAWRRRLAALDAAAHRWHARYLDAVFVTGVVALALAAVSYWAIAPIIGLLGATIAELLAILAVGRSVCVARGSLRNFRQMGGDRRVARENAPSACAVGVGSLAKLDFGPNPFVGRARR